MRTRDEVLDAARDKAREYMSKEAIEEYKATSNAHKTRVRHGLLPADFQTADTAHEERINKFISEHRTWRENVPLLRSYEYWRLRAAYYPYIDRSDDRDNFFLRGITCHPRLSDYPMCKSVIRDYFVCRDKNPVMQLANVCAPLKEQFCACINEVFVKNHERGDKKFNESREAYFQEQHDKRFHKMLAQAEESIESKSKLQD